MDSSRLFATHRKLLWRRALHSATVWPNDSSIHTAMVTSKMSPAEKQAIIDKFNHEDKAGMAMILTFKVSSCGLNFQKKSWNSTFIDPPPNVPIGVQAVGR